MTGCQWRRRPRIFQPSHMMQGDFHHWCDNGLWGTINQHLPMAAREALGCETSPTAGVIDSQSGATLGSVPGSGNHQATRHHRGLQTLAAAVSDGKKHRLDQSQSQSCQGLQGHHRKHPRLDHDHRHQAAFTISRKSLINDSESESNLNDGYAPWVAPANRAVLYLTRYNPP